MLQFRWAQKWRDLQCLCLVGQTLHEIAGGFNAALEPRGGCQEWTWYQIHGQIQEKGSGQYEWDTGKNQQETLLQKQEETADSTTKKPVYSSVRISRYVKMDKVSFKIALKS